MKTATKTPASSLSIWAAMISVYIAWGSTYLAIRFAVETIPPFLMAGIRFLIAGGILFIWRRLAGDKAPLGLHWRSAAIIGSLLLVGGNGFVSWAEQHVVSGIAALLVGSAPLFMILVDTFRPHISRPRPGWVTYLGVLLGFGGILLLVGPSELTGLKGDVDPLGIVVLTVAAFFWALGSLYSREADLPDSPLLGTGMEMLCGGVGLIVLGTLTGQWGQLHLAAVTPRSLSGLAYLITFGSLIGFGSYTWLLRNAPTSLVSTYAFVNPVVAVFMGNILDNEPLTPRILLATAVIIGAVVVVTLTLPSARKKEPMPVTEVSEHPEGCNEPGD
jgi:drug/metabolite transporter (DMT)-like permease